MSSSHKPHVRLCEKLMIGRCPFGDAACHYNHEATRRASSKGICILFNNQGACPNGPACGSKHKIFDPSRGEKKHAHKVMSTEATFDLLGGLGGAHTTLVATKVPHATGGAGAVATMMSHHAVGGKAKTSGTIIKAADMDHATSAIMSMSRSAGVVPAHKLHGGADYSTSTVTSTKRITTSVAEKVPIAPDKHDFHIHIDGSGSMAGERLHYAKVSVRELHDGLLPKDSIALYQFNNRVSTVIPMKKKCEGIDVEFHTAVNMLTAGGGTALYDAFVHGVAAQRAVYESKQAKLRAMGSVKKFRPRKQVLVFVTDGEDCSSTTTLAQAKEALGKYNVPVFLIAIGNAVEQPAIKELQTLKNFSVIAAANARDVPAAFQAVRHKLQYRTNTVTEVHVVHRGISHGAGLDMRKLRT